LPSNQSPLGALPARFRRQRLLIVGCGDVGLRVARGLRSRLRVLALTQSPERAACAPPASRRWWAIWTTAALAPGRPGHARAAPGAAGAGRDRCAQPGAGAALRRRALPQALVYASTTGVYGDCAGAWVAETRPWRRPRRARSAA
jgi:nucleoside-diphosphate-sugar epimerase